MKKQLKLNYDIIGKQFDNYIITSMDYDCNKIYINIIQYDVVKQLETTMDILTYRNLYLLSHESADEFERLVLKTKFPDNIYWAMFGNNIFGVSALNEKYLKKHKLEYIKIATYK